MADALLGIMRGNFELSREVLLDERYMALYLLATGKLALELLAPLIMALLVIALAGPVSLGGWLNPSTLLMRKNTPALNTSLP